MARYILLTATFGSPPNRPAQKFGKGTMIADTIGNALAGDIVWPLLTNAAAATPHLLAPLDAAAATVMGQPITTLAAIAANPGWGNLGTNLTGGAGLDAGT